MAIDIMRIKNDKGINNNNAVMSTTQTGYSSIRSIRPNYPVDLTIANIEDKYSERFDDPSYYYGIGNSTILGA